MIEYPYKAGKRMNDKRIQHLLQGDKSKIGAYILYFMQQSQRTKDNHALAYATSLANMKKLPLAVFFSLDPTYPYANFRSLAFMLEGLKEIRNDLLERGIGFLFRIGNPALMIRDYLQAADSVIIDTGYLQVQRAWRKDLYFEIAANHPNLDLIQVESDTIVPVKIASDKLEYGAYTIRPKLLRLVDEFLDVAPFNTPTHPYMLDLFSDRFPDDISAFLTSLDVKPLTGSCYHGGYRNAAATLTWFVHNCLPRYDEANDPALDLTSKMSMYLHFGQISPREIYLEVRNQPAPVKAKTDYLEQLLVRRELAWNYVHYNPGYSSFSKMTEPWAYRTMAEHENDHREYRYGMDEYLDTRTHDPYFNAAMREMLTTGYMHNYMRMYWAKKIIEWSDSYQEAFQTILALNDTYFLDGRDPSSYAGIAWCFGKHDRPWRERPVFGKLRTMTASGLERKFAIETYVSKWK